MKLLNCMLGAGLGGIEQAALNYHEALAHEGIEVTSVLHPQAAFRPAFDDLTSDIITLSHFGEWDWLAARRLRALAAQQQAEAIIAHGNRAIGLALKAGKGRTPVIGVAHNYRFKKRMPKCDAVLCITRDIIEELVHLNVPRERLFHIPNLVRARDLSARTCFHDPVTIGTLGRFVEKKGMDVLLLALQALSQHGVPFRAIIGGDGPLAGQLQAQAQQLGIADQVTFPGWVKDKTAFFDSLDLFVLPSHSEAFGIVLIEAMAAGLPCITTDTEGPCEIITHERDAIMVEKARPYQMAQALRELVESPERAFALGAAAHRTTRERYALNVVSHRLHAVLHQIVN